MKIRSLLLSAVVFVCVVTCGAPRTEVTGEVFITTAGAGSYKMSLVEITAVPEKEMLSFLESKRADYEAAVQEADDVRDNCGGLNCGRKWLEARSSVLDVFFDPLPKHEAQTDSDSDGKFKLTLTKPGTYALMARASRSTGGEMDEKYYWIVWMKADGNPKSVSLNNNNVKSSAMPFEALLVR